jgi:hypothetical protein
VDWRSFACVDSAPGNESESSVQDKTVIAIIDMTPSSKTLITSL